MTKIDLAQAEPNAEALPLSRMQKLVAKQMEQSWTTVPHVTHHDGADVEAIERYRAALAAAGKPRLSALGLYAKAVAETLVRFPRFNAIYKPAESILWQKHHCNIGFAISINDGLVVGVVRNCEEKSAGDIAAEVADLAEKARTTGLSFADMSEGTFTISSLGQNGGEGFTPIVNIPQVAILGLGRLQERPVRAADGGLEWTRILPLSLSYDHRVIGGADAAAFLTALRQSLQTPAEA